MRALIVILFVTIALYIVAKETGQQVIVRPGVASFLTEKDPPSGFAYAMEKKLFEFPRDHGAHPEFRSEWWYFTGNTASEQGREFGFQLTLFRFALTPQNAVSNSPWRQNNLYMGHFAISDLNRGVFHSFERQSRAALNLAGADNDPLKLWIRDWSFEQVDSNTEVWRLRARQDGFEIDLITKAERPITLQGDDGLSKKNHIAGNASYYYSITRLATKGTISTPMAKHVVIGDAWFDHEWSTSALAEGQLGWDWFSLQLDDQREIMFYQIRDTDGRRDNASHGVIVSRDGGKTILNTNDLNFRVEKHWRSKLSGARYPATWHVEIPSHKLKLTITPRFSDQEWRKNFTYWEGSVNVSGVSNGRDIYGKGYVELVGYD